MLGTGLLIPNSRRLFFDPNRAALADFTGDDRVDISVVVEGKLNVFRNNGQRRFQGIQQIDTQARALTVVDFDLDGDLDLALGTGEGQSFLNDGSGNFRALGGPLGLVSRLVAGDLNGDGFPDLVDEVLRVFMNQGNGAVTQQDGFLGSAKFLVDFDGDQDLDVISDSNLMRNDTASPPSGDCDRNGTPDECDLAMEGVDASGNGVIDVCEATPFRRGDVNVDGEVYLSDVISLLNHLFDSGDVLCARAADGNDSGELTIADASFKLDYFFFGKAPPFAACGLDYTPDALGCEAFARCE
jgi:hypothetical protein